MRNGVIANDGFHKDHIHQRIFYQRIKIELHIALTLLFYFFINLTDNKKSILKLALENLFNLYPRRQTFEAINLKKVLNKQNP